MGLKLKKGENLSLTKKFNGKTKFTLGISWDVSGEKTFDLDISAIELKDKAENGGKAISMDHAVGYFSVDSSRPNYENITFPLPNGKIGAKDPESAIKYNGDCRDGRAEGDDETIDIDFSKINPNVKSVIVVVSIYDESGKQNFGMVKNAMANLYEEGSEISSISFELQEDFSGCTCLEFIEFYLHNGEWKIRAIGEGNSNDLAQELKKFGLPIEE